MPPFVLTYDLIGSTGSIVPWLAPFDVNVLAIASDCPITVGKDAALLYGGAQKLFISLTSGSFDCGISLQRGEYLYIVRQGLGQINVTIGYVPSQNPAGT